MLSSKEIRSIEFEKCMRGYRQEQVKETLDKIAAQLEQTQKEKDDMEKKLYILAGKVEEYRNDEDMLKTAMINAQRMGESVIKEARQKAENIIREADSKASLINEKAREKLQNEENRYITLQEKVAEFKAEVLAIYKNHIESLSDLPVNEEIFEQSEKYSEIKDADFSNAIISRAEELAEPVISVFEEDEEDVEDIPVIDIEKTSFNAIFPTELEVEQENLSIEKLNEEETLNESLGLNGVDYQRISLEDEDVKLFNADTLPLTNSAAKDDDDVIEMPPLKKSVFAIFGDNNK